jgi:hypothetical protein
MLTSAKTSITSWWLLALLALFLWYRNVTYDRALSVFVLTLAIIQLIEYGVYSNVNPSQSGTAIYLTLWLQCLVLAIGVFIFIRDHHDSESTSLQENIVNSLAGWNVVLQAIIFVIALITSYWSEEGSTLAVTNQDGLIEWKDSSGGTLLGKWWILYALSIATPLLLLLAKYTFTDITLIVLLVYGIVSACYVMKYYQANNFGSMWAFLSVGFVFLLWFAGLFGSITVK